MLDSPSVMKQLALTIPEIVDSSFLSENEQPKSWFAMQELGVSLVNALKMRKGHTLSLKSTVMLGIELVCFFSKVIPKDGKVEVAAQLGIPSWRSEATKCIVVDELHNRLLSLSH